MFTGIGMLALGLAWQAASFAGSRLDSALNHIISAIVDGFGMGFAFGGILVGIAVKGTESRMKAAASSISMLGLTLIILGGTARPILHNLGAGEIAIITLTMGLLGAGVGVESALAALLIASRRREISESASLGTQD